MREGRGLKKMYKSTYIKNKKLSLFSDLKMQIKMNMLKNSYFEVQ